MYMYTYIDSDVLTDIQIPSKGTSLSGRCRSIYIYIYINMYIYIHRNPDSLEWHIVVGQMPIRVAEAAQLTLLEHRGRRVVRRVRVVRVRLALPLRLLLRLRANGGS